MFLILASWSLLPLYIVETGGDAADAGLVMGAIGITSLGALPFITPLVDEYGRKPFIVGGVFIGGLSNLGFLFFDTYTHWMIGVRLLQGCAFAACFNACSTAVVDLVPRAHRAQGIGLFAVSSSLAVAFGPFISEMILLDWGYGAYFGLLTAFGMVGTVVGLLVREPPRVTSAETGYGFFPTALRERHWPNMLIAVVFGAGFAAMNNFFPLYARTLGLRAGLFFIFYGFSLLAVRILLGHTADKVRRERLILACLLGFAAMLVFTSMVRVQWHTCLLGVFFGLLQGLAYPAQMARMVDRAHDYNRAVVVGLFTGAFGVGINTATLLWGFLAELRGLQFMYAAAGGIVLVVGLAAVIPSPAGRR